MPSPWSQSGFKPFPIEGVSITLAFACERSQWFIFSMFICMCGAEYRYVLVYVYTHGQVRGQPQVLFLDI